jgi:hypothetical protein
MTDHHAGASSIYANIVGIFAQIDLPDRLIVTPAKQTDRSVTRVCNVPNVGCGQICDALRLPQIGKGANDPMVRKVDHPYAVILQFGDEQALALQINCHVINSASYVAERYLGLKLQWRLYFVLSRSHVETEWAQYDQQRCPNEPGPMTDRPTPSSVTEVRSLPHAILSRFFT